MSRVISFLFCMMMTLLWFTYPELHIEDRIGLTFIWGLASIACLVVPEAFKL